MSTTTASQGKMKRKNAPGNRPDIGWGHREEVDPKKKTVRSKYCSVVRGGWIYRLKHHLAGTQFNSEPCSKYPMMSEQCS